MSDTPKTDANEEHNLKSFGAFKKCDSDFARTLERENQEQAALIEKLVEALKQCFSHLGKEIQKKSLNESAFDGTQKLSREVATLLDSLAHAQGFGNNQTKGSE